jgi:hypothetical protein
MCLFPYSSLVTSQPVYSCCKQATCVPVISGCYIRFRQVCADEVQCSQNIRQGLRSFVCGIYQQFWTTTAGWARCTMQCRPSCKQLVTLSAFSSRKPKRSSDIVSSRSPDRPSISLASICMLHRVEPWHCGTSCYVHQANHRQTCWPQQAENTLLNILPYIAGAPFPCWLRPAKVGQTCLHDHGLYMHCTSCTVQASTLGPNCMQ